VIFAQQGKYDLSLSKLQEALDVRIMALGADHMDVSSTQYKVSPHLQSKKPLGLKLFHPQPISPTVHVADPTPAAHGCTAHGTGSKSHETPSTSTSPFIRVAAAQTRDVGIPC
jgi:hypothetical protein